VLHCYTTSEALGLIFQCALRRYEGTRGISLLLFLPICRQRMGKQQQQLCIASLLCWQLVLMGYRWNTMSDGSELASAEAAGASPAVRLSKGD